MAIQSKYRIDLLTPTLYQGVAECKDLNGKVYKVKAFGKIILNLTEMLLTKFHRIAVLLSTGQWVNNKSVSAKLENDIKILTAISNQSLLIFENEHIKLNLNEMKEVCRVLKRSGANTDAVTQMESKLLEIEKTHQDSLLVLDHGKKLIKDEKLEESQPKKVVSEAQKMANLAAFEQEFGSAPGYPVDKTTDDFYAPETIYDSNKQPLEGENVHRSAYEAEDIDVVTEVKDPEILEAGVHRRQTAMEKELNELVNKAKQEIGRDVRAMIRVSREQKGFRKNDAFKSRLEKFELLEYNKMDVQKLKENVIGALKHVEKGFPQGQIPEAVRNECKKIFANLKKLFPV